MHVKGLVSRVVLVHVATDLDQQENIQDCEQVWDWELRLCLDQLFARQLLQGLEGFDQDGSRQEGDLGNLDCDQSLPRKEYADNQSDRRADGEKEQVNQAFMDDFVPNFGKCSFMLHGSILVFMSHCSCGKS